MPEQYDDKWGGVDKRGRAVLLTAFFMAAGIAAVHLDRLFTGLENDMANGWRITVTEPVDALVEKIQNTGNLYEVTLISLLSSFAFALLFLAASMKVKK